MVMPPRLPPTTHKPCGWCVDVYGVYWQVLPQNIGQLMADADARAKPLSMGKIDLSRLS